MNIDPVVHQIKPRHKYKTNYAKADISILGNKNLLRYFQKVNSRSINENTDILENLYIDFEVRYLPLSLILVEF